MSSHHHHAGEQHTAHAHHHAGHAHPAAQIGLSLLRMSLPQRLLIATGLSALIWLGVLWATA